MDTKDDMNAADEPKEFSSIQRKFYDLMTEYKMLKEYVEQGVEVDKNKRRMDNIIGELWDEMKYYAKRLITESLYNCKESNDYADDVEQACAEAFFSCLWEYNPLRCRPTTYFSPRFMHAIFEYKCKESMHMTTHYAKITGKIRAVISRCCMDGVDTCTVEQIHQETGLPVKTIERTINIMNTSQTVNLDDCYDMESRRPSMDEEMLNIEKKDILKKVLSDTLSKEEINFVQYRMNPDGCKERSFKELAEIYGEGVFRIKKMRNGIIEKLRSNQELKDYFPEYSA